MNWANDFCRKQLRLCSGTSTERQTAIGWYLNFDADILHSYLVLGSGLSPFPRSFFSAERHAKKMQLTTEGES